MFEPNVFLEASITTEQQQLNEKLAMELANEPRVYEIGAAETRRRRESGLGRAGMPVYLTDIAVETVCPGLGDSGPVGLRIFRPDVINGVLLWIHGGGWVLGNSKMQDQALWDIAEQSCVAVVSVEYRLAPEHPYPSGPDDCEAAALWLIEHASSEFGTSNLVIGGGSAGGHLAAVTLLRLRDRHGFSEWRGADLVYGAYELSGGSPSQSSIGKNSLVIDEKIMNWFYDSFLQNNEDRRDPDISPLYADLYDMPPALFTVGTLDPLLDDSLFMHARWVAAGNASDLAVYPGGPHAFNNQQSTLATTANNHRISTIKEWIS